MVLATTQKLVQFLTAKKGSSTCSPPTPKPIAMRWWEERAIQSRWMVSWTVSAPTYKSQWQSMSTPLPHPFVAFCWRKSTDFEVEETRAWGPNVMTSQLVTGRNRFYVVGGYIPPSDLTTLAQIQKAWDQCPKGCIPLFLGDLNINLESPRDERDEQIAEECDFRELEDMSRNFLQPRRRRARGRWS